MQKYTIRRLGLEFDIFVDPDKRIVIAKSQSLLDIFPWNNPAKGKARLFHYWNSQRGAHRPSFCGRATCALSDEWKESVGVSLAIHRCWTKIKGYMQKELEKVLDTISQMNRGMIRKNKVEYRQRDLPFEED